MTGGGAGRQTRVILRALRAGTQFGARGIFQLPAAASVVWFRKLMLWQYKDGLQAFTSISDRVTESMKPQGSENKNSNLEKILGTRVSEFCY